MYEPDQAPDRMVLACDKQMELEEDEAGVVTPSPKATPAPASLAR